MLIGTVQQIWRYPVKSMAGEKLSETEVGALGIPGDRGWAIKCQEKSELKTGTRIPLLMQCASQYCVEPVNGDIPHVAITLPDGSRVLSSEADIDDRLSSTLGTRVKLWPRQPATDKEHYRRPGVGRILAPLTDVPGFRALLPTLTKLPNIDATLRATFSRTADEPVPDISNLPRDLFEFTSPLGTYFDAFPIHVLTSASLSVMAAKNPGADWDVRRFRPNFFVETIAELEGLLEADWTGKTLRLGSVEIKCEMPCVRCGMTTNAQKDLPKDNSVLRSIVKEADQNLGSYANVTKDGSVKIGDPVELI